MTKRKVRPLSTARKAASSNSAVQMGRLVMLHIRNESGDSIHKVNRALAWRPAGRSGKQGSLLVGTEIGAGNPQTLSKSVVTIHNKFHQAPPQAAKRIQFPDRNKGSWRPIGRLVALTYRVPKGIRSPQKNPYLWHHWFGDHGERGHGEATDHDPQYPERYFPRVLVNEHMDFIIERVYGNRFFVTDWLYY